MKLLDLYASDVHTNEAEEMKKKVLCSNTICCLQVSAVDARAVVVLG